MSAPGARRAMLTDRTALRHFAEMLVAMLVGMMALAPLWPELSAGVEALPTTQALVMATNMTVGMTALMVWRRHRPVAVAEMALAMYLPFVVLFPPYWAGGLPAEAVLLVGHLLMLPAMVAAMLWRPEEYTAHRPRLART